MGIVKPKATSLSHLVDSRIGNPDADLSSRLYSYRGEFGTDTENWKAFGNNTINRVVDPAAENGYALEVTNIDSSSGAYKLFSDLEKELINGVTYFAKIRCRVDGSGSIRFNDGDGYLPSHVLSAQYVWYYDVFTKNGSGSIFIGMSGISASGSVYIDQWDIHEHSGEELVPDPDVGFVANQVNGGWNVYGTNTKEQDGNAVKCTYVDHASGMYNYLRIVTENNVFNNVASGDKVKFVVKCKINTGSAIVRVWDGAVYHPKTITNTEYEIFEWNLTMSEVYVLFRFDNMSAGEIVWIEIISLKKITGLVAAHNMIPSPDGVLVDISGEGNNGTIVGAVSSEDGMKFNGSTDYATLGASQILNGVQNATLAIRFKASPPLTEDRALWEQRYNGNAFSIRMTTLGALVCRFGGNTAFTTSDQWFGDNHWHNLVFLKSGNVVLLYVDGLFIYGNSDADDTISTTSDDNIVFGAGGDNGIIWKFLKCEIDNAKIFNYAFSEAEAIAYHNSFQKINQRHNFDDLGVGSTI